MQRSIFSNVAAGLKAERMPFRDYFRESWRHLEPANAFVDNWHYDCIGEHLEAVVMGQVLRLIINTPPRTWKSGEISVCFPSWVWTERPWTQFICGSYSANLAIQHSVHRRNLMNTPWYRSKWGNVFTFAADQDRKSQYENSALGHMLATSVGGTITGFGANIIIVDDWIDPRNSESEAMRKAAHLSYDVNVRTRLNDARRDAIIIAEQRTHAEDLTGHVMGQETWLRLDLPALFKARRVYSFPISKREMVCEAGTALQPVRIPLEILEATRKASGTRTFNAQQLQTPDSEHGTIVDRFWWRFYEEDPVELGKTAPFIGQSWDMAFVKSADSSFVVGLVGALRGAHKDILGESRDQRNYPDTKREVKRFSAEWPRSAYKWVENKANGPAIVDDLQGKDGIPGVIAVPPAIGDKVARMVRASAQIESGHVRLPNPYLRDEFGYRPDRYDPQWTGEKRINPRFQWVIEFIEELAVFPKEPNDRGDATSQLIVMLDGVPLDLRGGVQEPEETGNMFDAVERANNLLPFPPRNGNGHGGDDFADIFHGGNIFDV